MNSKHYPNCNNCDSKSKSCPGHDKRVPQPIYCSEYVAPISGFPFPEMVSRFKFFKNPSKTQKALREFLTARV